MTLTEKLEHIQKHHLGEWLSVRSEVEAELSKAQGTFCVCGRLATGMHEAVCRKFHDKVRKEAVRRIEKIFDIEDDITLERERITKGENKGKVLVK